MGKPAGRSIKISNPYLLTNYTPVLKSMPVPGIDSILTEPLVCVTFSKALVPYLLGLLEIYRWKDKFSGTDEEIITALGVIQDLVAAIAEGNCIMLDVRQNSTTPCILEKSTDGTSWTPFADLSLCPTPGRILRYNPTTDTVEGSTDGGVTWTPAPEVDPRHVTTSPPHITGNTKCDAAASMVRFISDTISSTTNGVSIGLTTTDLIALILGLLEVFGPYAVMVLAALAVLSIITAAGAEVVSAAMTSTVFDTLLCIFFCHVDDNGFLTADALSAVNGDIDTQIGGLAATILHALFLLTGEAGLNNAGAAGLDTDDCSGCDCAGPFCYSWPNPSLAASGSSSAWWGYAGYNSNPGVIFIAAPNYGASPAAVQLLHFEADIFWNGNNPAVGMNLIHLQSGGSIDNPGSWNTIQHWDITSAGTTHVSWDGSQGGYGFVLQIVGPNTGGGISVGATNVIMSGTGTWNSASIQAPYVCP